MLKIEAEYGCLQNLEPIVNSKIYKITNYSKRDLHNKTGNLSATANKGTWFYLTNDMNWVSCTYISHTHKNGMYYYTVQNEKGTQIEVPDYRIKVESTSKPTKKLCDDEYCPEPYSFSGNCNDLKQYINLEGLQDYDHGLFYPCCTPIPNDKYNDVKNYV